MVQEILLDLSYSVTLLPLSCVHYVRGYSYYAVISELCARCCYSFIIRLKLGTRCSYIDTSALCEQCGYSYIITSDLCKQCTFYLCYSNVILIPLCCAHDAVVVTSLHLSDVHNTVRLLPLGCAHDAIIVTMLPHGCVHDAVIVT